ncbi:hypothetical protein SAMN05444503_1174 [Pseudomonas sp. BS3767]|nr:MULTISPECIES: DUF5681 domain-containing protein [Pseudomonas]RXU25528.1 hypothetical protein B0A92_10370 [Pseudomonas syringae]SDI56835.1 hypothetical protein SAMN05444503_1174 [Pseudomonas sp. BS3767]
MTDRKPAEGRTRKGQFQPGFSGNPGGRSGKTQAIREKLASGAEAVTKKVLAAAKKGDMQACRLILERLVPALKPVSEPVVFDLDDTDLPATARSIMAAVAGGVLSPDQGKALIDSVSSMARVIEIAELEQQLNDLRALMEAQR